jgi:hypothetical protein
MGFGRISGIWVFQIRWQKTPADVFDFMQDSWKVFDYSGFARSHQRTSNKSVKTGLIIQPACEAVWSYRTLTPFLVDWQVI